MLPVRAGAAGRPTPPHHSRHRRGPALAALAALALLVAAPGCTGSDPPQPAPPWPAGPTPSWQWQLTGEPDLTVDASVFALDAFDTTTEQVRQLRARDRRLLCYVRVGTYEPTRADATRYPGATLGRAGGSDGERWLDVRQWSALEPILADRFRLCRGKGFQAVFPDDLDGYAHSTGFPLTFDDQLVFNRRIADLARRIGLSPGLTNDLGQVVALERDFDFAVNEGCFQRRECHRLLPFVDAGKPVFQVEYVESGPDGSGGSGGLSGRDGAGEPGSPSGRDGTARIGSSGPETDICTAAIGYGFATIRKRRSLDAWRQPCLP